MNHNPQEMYYPAHLPGGQSQAPQAISSGGSGGGVITQFSPQQHHPSILQPGPAQYSPNPASYSQYGNYSNGLTSPQSAGQAVSGNMCPQSNVLPLPPNITGAQPGMTCQNYGPPQGYDMSGQIAPPGVKPKVTATLWEDEGSLCFQVEAKGVCVARREDDNMINGTKLLNVAGMTRGRRDGILKGEKVKKVVKIGPMHLKGVWIPFERALEFANKEKITELLYPLFVQDISRMLYHPANQTRSNAVMAAAERRKFEQNNQFRNIQHGLPSMNHHHHHQHHHHQSMNNSLENITNASSHNLSPHANLARSSLERQNFPTPPSSASGVMGNMSTPDSNYQWGPPQAVMGNVQNSNPISIDSGMNNGRSMPTTPASTPPGTSIQGIQYQQGNQPYETSRNVYQTPSSSHHSQQQPHQQNSYPQQSSSSTTSSSTTSSSSDNQNMFRYQTQPSGSYIKGEMAPPAARTTKTEPENQDVKQTGILMHSQSSVPLGHEDERDHDHDNEYTHGNSSTFDSSRNSYNYSTSNNTSVGTLSSDHSHFSTDISGSSNNSNSGRATPRTSTTTSVAAAAVAAVAQSYQSQTSGHNTNSNSNNNNSNNNSSPRGQATSSSNLYNVMSNERGATNVVNGSCGDIYTAQSDMNSISSYSSQQQTSLNGTGAGSKRSRDDDDEDDDSRPRSRGTNGDTDGIKRRNTGTMSGPGLDVSGLNRPRPSILQRRR